MSKIQWVKWKDNYGARYLGENKYEPKPPHGLWTKIMGVVARCEGNHDTVISYDGTGVTWGFMQWTFTSGRLQKLLQSFKAIQVMDFTTGDVLDTNLFDSLHLNERFRKYGFEIRSGAFWDLEKGKALQPYKNRSRIREICMGHAKYRLASYRKKHAISLAGEFAEVGKDFAVADAQIHYAKHEFKRGLHIKRPPLGKVENIYNLLDEAWETPAPALFYNLWQNNPAHAYKLFLNVKKAGVKGADYFDLAWKKANKSKFGNWGWGKPGNKQPRVIRIKKAVKEFYGIDLSYYK